MRYALSSIIIRLIYQLIILLTRIMKNEKINEKMIIIITKITKSLNSTISNLNRSLKISIYRKFIIIA